MKPNMDETLLMRRIKLLMDYVVMPRSKRKKFALLEWQSDIRMLNMQVAQKNLWTRPEMIEWTKLENNLPTGLKISKGKK